MLYVFLLYIFFVLCLLFFCSYSMLRSGCWDPFYAIWPATRILHNALGGIPTCISILHERSNIRGTFFTCCGDITAEHDMKPHLQQKTQRTG
jgi:hypothetical protein